MLDSLRGLEVWKRSCRLSVGVYKLVGDCRDYGFRDQVSRSGSSIPSNIAEGYERESGRDRVRFLTIAKGSCAECWTQLLVGTEAGFLDPEKTAPMIKELDEISRMLRGLIARFERADSRD